MTRPPWSRYFMDLARTVSTRATCPRRAVGCVLVRDRHVLASGYNGSAPGTAHCSDDSRPDSITQVGAGCLMVDGHCVRTIHAEANAVASAARHGTSIEGATAYVTTKPCWTCLKLLASAGVERVVYAEAYGSDYPARTPIGVECLT